MIMKSTMCVNWTAASVSSSGNSRGTRGAAAEDGDGRGRARECGRAESGELDAGRVVDAAATTTGLQSINIARARSRAAPSAASTRTPASIARHPRIGTVHADQLRRLPEREEARRHSGRRHQRLRDAARVLRLGRAVRADDGRDRRDGGGIRSPSARRRGRAQAATSGRRSRNTTTRCSSCCTRSSRRPTASDTELIGGEVDIFVGSNYILSVRHRTKKGFGNVRARTEREPELLQIRRGLRALRADGHRRRPVLSDPRRHGVGAGADRGADLRAQRGALEHRGALRVEAAAHGA